MGSMLNNAQSEQCMGDWRVPHPYEQGCSQRKVGRQARVRDYAALAASCHISAHLTYTVLAFFLGKRDPRHVLHVVG